MHPYITIGNMEIPVYGMLIIFPYIIGLILCIPIGKKYGLIKEYIFSAGTFSSAGLLIGSKLIYLVTKLPNYIDNYSNIYSKYTTIEKLEFLLGGYVFYGGLVGAILGVLIFSKVFNFDKWSLFSTLTPLIPFAHAFGRVGCFFGGCCYGIEYHGAFSISFNYNSLSPHLSDVPRFPVQLLEAALIFILFIIIYIYTYKKVPAGGKTLGFYIISYSIIRFLLEFLRGDIIRGIWFGLSTSQWISLLLLPIGILLLKKESCKVN